MSNKLRIQKTEDSIVFEFVFAQSGLVYVFVFVCVASSCMSLFTPLNVFLVFLAHAWQHREERAIASTQPENLLTVFQTWMCGCVRACVGSVRKRGP